MKAKDTAVLIVLMLIGEFIFLLPFVVTRIFRPTFLTVFEINNFQLGSAFSVYGIVAMISYFAGGPLADRFSPRQLLPAAFIATALGGIAMATVPSLWILTLLYGFWGMTTILMFWSGYIKVQREFGGQLSQGRSYGSVDAGRGFVAAFIASTSVLLLDFFLPVEAAEATKQDLSAALSKIILLFSGLTALGAFLVWFFLRGDKLEHGTVPRLSLEGIRSVIGRRTVWMQAIILLCAYVGYKCTDDFSLYAKDTFGYDDVNSAHMATVSFWMRPVAAIAAGFLGDRFVHSKIVMWCFIVMMLGSLVIYSGVLQAGMEAWIMVTIASTSAGIYGLRGLYYALFQEAKMPLVYTGSAAGLVSVVGYTPDVFMGPLMGVILDSNPGPAGHQYLFLLLAGFSVVGLLTAFLFRRQTSNLN